MPALHKQVHLCWNASLRQRRIVDERILDRVYRIILCVKQERGRRPASDVKIGIQLEVFLTDGQMTRIKSDREIGTAARFIGGVYNRVKTLLEMSADRGDHMTA